MSFGNLDTRVWNKGDEDFVRFYESIAASRLQLPGFSAGISYGFGGSSFELVNGPYAPRWLSVEFLPGRRSSITLYRGEPPLTFPKAVVFGLTDFDTHTYKPPKALRSEKALGAEAAIFEGFLGELGTGSSYVPLFGKGSRVHPTPSVCNDPEPKIKKDYCFSEGEGCFQQLRLYRPDAGIVATMDFPLDRYSDPPFGQAAAQAGRFVDYFVGERSRIAQAVGK